MLLSARADRCGCAIQADSGWLLPHVMKASFLLSLTKPGLLSEADAHLSHARALQAHATPRNEAQ